MILGKRLEDLQESDLEELRENKVAERRTIEYKKALPGGTDKEKREFLADASSFANTAGGYLVFGIEEEEGIPVRLEGLSGINQDQERLRFEHMLRDCIAPRMPGVDSIAVELSNGSHIIILSIPRSVSRPHMVTYSGWSKFFARNSAGKYQLDVGELRSLFNATMDAADRLREFRADRIVRSLSGESRLDPSLKGRVLLHVAPLDAFDPRVSIDVSRLEHDMALLAPLSIRGSDVTRRVHNFDGFATFLETNPPGVWLSSVQVFRNGIIEAEDCMLLLPRSGSDSTLPAVRATSIEQIILSALPRFFQFYQQKGIEPPLWVMLSLLGVRGSTIALPVAPTFPEPQQGIDRDELMCPEVLIEDYSVPLATALKPAFDAIWNAGGHRGSQNYDESGNRLP